MKMLDSQLRVLQRLCDLNVEGQNEITCRSKGVPAQEIENYRGQESWDLYYLSFRQRNSEMHDVREACHRRLAVL